MSAPLVGTATGQSHGIDRVRYTHDAMIDLILAHPEMSQGQLAKYFNFTEGWVSRVIGSDAFQARLAQRKEDVVDPEIRQTLEEKLQGLAHQSLAIVAEKMGVTKNPDLALKTLELTTKALGFGARDRNIGVQNNFVVALPPKATNEQDWAASARPQLQRTDNPQVAPASAAGEVVDVEAKPAPANAPQA